MDKPFKNIQEQVELLKSRGLTVEDADSAAEFLLYHNYYRVSGYSLTLRKDDVFYESATMQNIIDIYEFDHELRHILLKHLETIEIKMKSVYSYEFAQMYSPYNYEDSSLFADSDKHKEIMEKAERQKNLSLKNEAYLKHFSDTGQKMPIWAYVSLLTIADISLLYKISETELKNKVAEDFFINTPNRADLLSRFMHSMTIVRNLCAHGSRLYNRIFQQKPGLKKSELSLLIKNDKNIVDNQHLYGFIFVMRRLLSKQDFSTLKSEIETLSKKYPFVNLKYYGFREDWKEVL